MAAANHNRVIFNVELPEDFLQSMEQVMEEELQIAQRKWGISLDDELQEQVKRHSLNQLAAKVDLTMKVSWNFQRVLPLKIKGLTKSSAGEIHKDLLLPRDAGKVGPLKLLLDRDGYEVDDEDSDGAVSAEDLPSSALQTILTWLRTAIFYGVGSFR